VLDLLYIGLTIVVFAAVLLAGYLVAALLHPERF
jgi:K+-transporting ATPase KdpF subunit